MATVWIGEGYGVYCKARVVEIFIDFVAEVKARGLEQDFVAAVGAGDIYYDRFTIQVKDANPLVDVFLDVLKKHGVVPAIT